MFAWILDWGGSSWVAVKNLWLKIFTSHLISYRLFSSIRLMHNTSKKFKFKKCLTKNFSSLKKITGPIFRQELHFLNFALVLSFMSTKIYFSKWTKVNFDRIGILLPKLFWPTVRKNCSSDREKLLNFEAEGREF